VRRQRPLNGIDSLSKDRAAGRLFLWPEPAATLASNGLRSWNPWLSSMQQHARMRAALDERLIDSSVVASAMMRDREFVKFALQTNKLSIVVGGQGVHFFAGPCFRAAISDQEAAPQRAQACHVDHANVAGVEALIPHSPDNGLIFGVTCAIQI